MSSTMLQPRITRPHAGIEPSLTSITTCLNALGLCHRQPRPLSTPLQFIRHASHAQQGRANGPKDTAGRRLGAKKSASEYVIPGNIIFKQRGTKWHPGENCDIGKDHTIYATEAGYVCYYRNPALHPKRRYIGVALDKDGKRSQLPTPANAPTRRRLGMYASPIAAPPSSSSNAVAFLEAHLSANSMPAAAAAADSTVSATADGDSPIPAPAAPLGWRARGKAKAAATLAALPPLTLREGYENRVANFEIGRAAERKGVSVRAYDRGDRWLAWRKRTKKIKEAAIARASKASRKTKGKKVNKGGGQARSRARGSK